MSIIYLLEFCIMFLSEMDDKDPTSVIKMIKDLRSGSEAYRRSNSSTVSLRLSGTAYTPMAFNEANECPSPKKPRLDDSNNSNLNKAEVEIVPTSPWEWRRLKGQVIYSITVT